MGWRDRFATTVSGAITGSTGQKSPDGELQGPRGASGVEGSSLVLDVRRYAQDPVVFHLIPIPRVFAFLQ